MSLLGAFLVVLIALALLCLVLWILRIAKVALPPEGTALVVVLFLILAIVAILHGGLRL